MGSKEVEYSAQQYLAKFGRVNCPVCNTRFIKTFERTKGEMIYRVYVCAKCKTVIQRETVEC